MGKEKWKEVNGVRKTGKKDGGEMREGWKMER